MEKLTNEQLKRFIEFYKQMGVPADEFFVDGNVKNIYEL